MPMRRLLPLSVVAVACTLAACKEPTPTMDFTPPRTNATIARAAGGANFEAPSEVPPHQRAIAGAGGRCNIERVNGAGFTGQPLKVSREAPVRVVGWIVDDQAQSVPRMVELRFAMGDRLWKATVPVDVARRDVQALLGGAPAFANTGHASVLDLSALPAGTYRVYTAFQRKGVTWACDNGRVLDITP